MKTTLIKSSLAAAVLLSTLNFRPSIFAATTIDDINRYAYGVNIGWMDWSGGTSETATGAVIGAYVCSGYIYSANVGWINLGSGAPANGIQYQNLSANDFGVNQDGLGNLRGYAYGANIGWINFENTGAPKVNLVTGNLSGYVWSANCGWISLSNAVAYVQTDTISPGALDADGSGLPIAWELTYFGTTGVNPNADPDHDGMSNYQEYLAGTDPNNADSILRITDESIFFSSGGSGGPGGPSEAIAMLTWNSVPTRYYYIQTTPSLSSPVWTDSGLGLIAPTSTSTVREFANPDAPMRFYRVQAVRPLTP